MPLRLDAIIADTKTHAFAHIVKVELQGIDDAWAEQSKVHFLGSRGLYDNRTSQQIGKYVFTFFQNTAEKRNEVLDLDIVLDNATPVKLDFLEKLPKSSDSNEYYCVEISGTNQRLNVETVNRYMIPASIEGTTQRAYCSAFPFEATIYDNIDAFNSAFGFGEQKIALGEESMTVSGLSETFTAPGNIFTASDSEEDPWAFIIGTVKSMREIVISFGEEQHSAIIVTLESALGLLPTIMGREVFDLHDIAVGKIIAMNACIKANFSGGKYPVAGQKAQEDKPETKPKARKGWFKK